jgi:hypothetical protein
MDRINHSRIAFDKLFALMDSALSAGEGVTLTVEDAEPFVADNPTAP